MQILSSAKHQSLEFRRPKKNIVEWDKMADRKEIERKAADQLKDMAQRELKARRIF